MSHSVAILTAGINREIDESMAGPKSNGTGHAGMLLAKVGVVVGSWWELSLIFQCAVEGLRISVQKVSTVG